MADGWVIIKTKLDNSTLNKDLKNLKPKLEEFATKIGGGLKKGLSVGLEIGKKIGKTFLNIVGIVGKVGISMFGITSIITVLLGIVKALAKALKEAFGKNQETMANVKYTLWAIGQAIVKIADAIAKAVMPSAQGFADLLVKILNFFIRIVQYVGYLVSAWTGINLFEDASVDNYAKKMKEAEESSAGTAKNAKEIKKQLAGFDEMNVISDNSGGGDTGGGGGFSMPTLDFTNLEGLEQLEWLNTIKDIGLWVIDNWEDVVTTLLLVKLFIDILTGNWLGIIIDLIGILIALFFKAKDAIGVVADNWKASWELVKNFMVDKVLKPIGDFFSNLWQKIKDGVKAVVDWIKEKFNTIKDFFKNIISTIVGFFKTLGSKVGDAIGGAFKAVVNGVLSAVERILNFPIRQINNLLDIINDVPGINISKLSTFNLPRLAKGGIINQPGRGVPIGSAIGGEKGQEGVIPLTDSQQMALLGEAIGKYITINATIPVYAYNRQVDRQIQRIKAEDNFAGNR